MKLLLLTTNLVVATSLWGRRPAKEPALFLVRGGAEENSEEEERYSRQVFTLGAKAHGRVRGSTVVLDGPPESGLMFECAKNLALSGVGRLAILESETESPIYSPLLDDLGRAYQRAARTELGLFQDSSTTSRKVLLEYIRRLNPGIQVDFVGMEDLPLLSEDDSRGVIVSIDRPFSSQQAINKEARSRGYGFVSIDTAGVFGRIFTDFGDTFQVDDADGEAPLVVPLDRIEENDGIFTIYCVEGEKHDVSKGDVIEFQLRDGSISEVECCVSEVHTPYRFSLKPKEDVPVTWMEELNAQAATFRRKKIPTILSFEPIDAVYSRAIVDGSLFTPSDLDKSFDETRRKNIFACFQCMSSFTESHGLLKDKDGYDKFENLVVSLLAESNEESGVEKSHVRNFFQTCAARFVPHQAIMGAIGAQEVIKGVTNLYHPIHQILMYDCDEVLQSSPGQRMEEQGSTSTSQGLYNIVGPDIVEKLQEQRVFVVGAGAIGCEVLKNLASLGAGSRDKGLIVLTDMDTIEKSNLSRQFLFRDKDIGEFKSSAAAAAARTFCDKVNILPHSSKVGDDQDHFQERFWKNVDTVLNALDNVEARLYMDSQCVAHGKSLVDAGTLGPKGNVQVVVPYQSESYASSADPPEQAIPVCTLKNFPYAIAHTIQWGRDIFDGLFTKRPLHANEVSDKLPKAPPSEIAERLLTSLGRDAAIQRAQELQDDLNPKVPTDKDGIKRYALSWAVRLAHRLFRESVQELMKQHPLDSKDEDDEPFWSGTRRPPKTLWYEPSSEDSYQRSVNDNFIEFVRCGARLRMKALTGQDAGDSFTDTEAQTALMTTALYHDVEPIDGCPTEKEVEVRLSKITPRKLFETEFEKDIDSNGHVAFVTAASNLRAVSYGIPPASKMQTRKVAGKIIPAMISTTALVSALSCIEWIKLVQNAPLHLMRNSFCNLALPFFASTAPLPAESSPGLHGQEYSLWDRVEVKEKKKDQGGISMKRLIRRILRKVSPKPDGLKVLSISFGPFLLYTSFLHEDDNSAQKVSLWDVIQAAQDEEEDEDFGGRDDDDDEDIMAIELSPDANYVDLTVIVEDGESGEEVELPPVRVRRRP